MPKSIKGDEEKQMQKKRQGGAESSRPCVEVESSGQVSEVVKECERGKEW